MAQRTMNRLVSALNAASFNATSFNATSFRAMSPPVNWP
jgi:hypothetical protein